MKTRSCFMTIWLAIFSSSFAQPDSSAFRTPPPSARPWAYWFWMDGNISQEGISADFEAMQKAGIGGVLAMEVDVGVPRGSVKFMSEKWREMFRHAVLEAERFGLQISLNSGPGWTGSGGPWIDGPQAMQHLVASDTTIMGGRLFQGRLPQPEPYPPFFGKSGWPAEMTHIYENYYQDVAVLAFPALSIEQRIQDVSEKALYVRAPYSSQPNVKAEWPVQAEYPPAPEGARINPDQIIDLTSQLAADGQLAWQVPRGRWTLLRFGRTSTGANTRPAPQPGFGLECDKFNRAAFDVHWQAYIGTLLRDIGPRPMNRTTGWTMLHIDSWEMGAQNWTGFFRQEFIKRRGYDLLPFLPTLTGRIVRSLEISERFLWDLRQTSQELLLENHAGYLRELAHRHGFTLSIEPYDMNPTADLSLGGIADVPMCEFWAQNYGFNTNYSCFEAVSIAHTLGRPIIAAEAFTADDKEAWKLHPAAMKAQADWAFCTGINRLAFHRYAHQPWLDRFPGMTMGPYGVHWERTQTWWPLAHGFHTYLARCQYLLQQGEATADICLLTPEGAPYVFRPMDLPEHGQLPDRPGYNFDGCAPEVLLNGASVQNGLVQLPGGARYRLLVLPQTETMSPQLLRKINQLIHDGATVFGSAPKKATGLSGYPQSDQELQQLTQEMWRSDAKTGDRVLGKGRLLWHSLPTQATYPSVQMLQEILSGMGILADFSTDAPFRYTHRRIGAIDLFFVANSMDHPIQAPCRFRVTDKTATIWNPMTGAANESVPFAQKAGFTEVVVDLDAHGSVFIVFSPEAISKKSDPIQQPLPIKTIDGTWQVSFDVKMGGPAAPVPFTTLTDWSKNADEGIRYYSGMADYVIHFDLPRIPKGSLWLDLGEVRELAQIQLNGHDLGVLWKAPFRVNVSSVIQRKKNELIVRVANLWPNRLIGDAALPSEKQFTWSTYRPYKADDPLLPSGLLGPVTILQSR